MLINFWIMIPKNCKNFFMANERACPPRGGLELCSPVSNVCVGWKMQFQSFGTVVTFVKLGDLHEFARQIYKLRSDLHDLICSFLWALQEFRFTSFQKGRDYHWFATFEKTRSTLICNKTVTFFKRKWKRFEATLHLLIIWKSIVKGLRKEVLFSKELRFKQSERIKIIVKSRTCFALHH